MELTHHLETPLKRLRLSGILETLDARNQQAIDGQWSYVEFLSRLLEDEVVRREHKQLALRVRRATLNTSKTLEAFDFAFNPTINRQRVLDLAAGDYIRSHRNVLLCGPTGVGKSHLAQGLAHEACVQGFDVHPDPQNAPAHSWWASRWLSRPALTSLSASGCPGA
jgi:DNA replication protein DnaC